MLVKIIMTHFQGLPFIMIPHPTTRKKNILASLPSAFSFLPIKRKASGGGVGGGTSIISSINNLKILKSFSFYTRTEQQKSERKSILNLSDSSPWICQCSFASSASPLFNMTPAFKRQRRLNLLEEMLPLYTEKGTVS